MNTEKKIEQSLRDAPKPTAPDDLLDRLQKDVSLGEVKTQRSGLHMWFAPAGGQISLRRVAAAAVIAIAVLLPLSYGATKVIKYFKVSEIKFEYPEDNGVQVYGVGGAIGSSNPNFTEEDARKINEEFYKLYKEGKAKEVEPGVWVVTLSNGEGFAYGGDPELLGLSEAERRELLKKQFDEIHELRKAGKFERTFIKEIEVDGVKHRIYRDSFTLSNGKVIKMGAGEPVTNEDNQ